MPIDYSKWDKIELSDDSDIEVHPNVDKNSFIRWKQQSIHEERAKRNQDIKNLEFQISMYSHLNKRVDKLLSQLSTAELTQSDAVQKFLNANFDKDERSEGDNVDPDMPAYNEMVLDLFEQLERDAKKEGKSPNDGNVIKELMLKHRSKIDDVTREAHTKLDQLYKEKSTLISSDDIHTGFEKSFINKAEDDSSISGYTPPPVSKITSDFKIPAPPMAFIEYEDDVMKLAPETVDFGEIPVNDYKKSEEFLLNHLPIISDQQKDALMMKAFDSQMKGDVTKTYQIIHQSELLAYVREVYDMKKIPYLHVDELSNVIKMFFQRVFYNNINAMGKQSFLESVKAKFEHVKQRVKVMEQEEVEEGVETIQLKSLDDSTELKVNLPDFHSKDPQELKKVEAFDKLSKEMQEAVKAESLDMINEVFAEMSIEEAEKVLDIFNEGEIIGVNALLEDEDEFKELQEQYNSERGIDQLNIQEEADPEERESTPPNPSGDVDTADIVD